MNLLRKALFTAAMVICLGTLQPLQAQEAAPVIHDDWQVLCGGEEPCRMAQTIAQPATSRVILQVKVFRGETPTMLVTFPLGILLSPGWSFQVDGGRRTVTPFEICNTSGCHAGVRLDADLIQRLKRGNKLIVGFRDAANEPVTPEVSLIGFTKAWEALE